MAVLSLNRSLTLSVLLCLSLLCACAAGDSLHDELSASSNECAPAIGSATRAAASSAAPGMTVLNFAENKADNVFNPERGWSVNIYLNNARQRKNITDGDYVRVGRRVVIALFDLRDFTWPGARLSAAKLGELTSFLDALRVVGMKAVFRAAYDFLGAPNPEPKDLGDLLAHQDQIAAALRSYTDVVFHVQCGMFGPWGEMHNSRFGGDMNALATVARKWLDSLPATIGVSMRTPAHMQSVLSALPASYAPRIGFYNDCFFGSATDYDTYPQSRQKDLQWLQGQTRGAMMGGEACPPVPGQESFSDPKNAIPEMILLHTTYLNRDWYPPIYVGDASAPKVVGWNNRAVCNAKQGDASENGYEYVSKRLGYRYVLRSGAVTSAVPAGGLLHLVLNVQNIGFSAIKTPRTIQIVLSNGAKSYTASVQGDPRTWHRDSGIVSLEWYLRLPQDITQGAWNVDLAIPDPAPALASKPAFAIQFANLNTWQAATGTNRLFAIAVGPADSSSVAGDALREVEAPPPASVATSLAASAASSAASAATSAAATSAATATSAASTGGKASDPATTVSASATSGPASASSSASVPPSSTSGGVTVDTTTASTTASTASTAIASAVTTAESTAAASAATSAATSAASAATTGAQATGDSAAASASASSAATSAVSAAVSSAGTSAATSAATTAGSYTGDEINAPAASPRPASRSKPAAWVVPVAVVVPLLAAAALIGVVVYVKIRHADRVAPLLPSWLPFRGEAKVTGPDSSAAIMAAPSSSSSTVV